MQQELIALKREIRDLKTAQSQPSIMKFFGGSFTIPQDITKGFHYWTIQYEASENITEPITYHGDFLYVPFFYDSATNTHKIVLDIPYDGTFAGMEFLFFSTRPIASITKD